MTTMSQPSMDSRLLVTQIKQEKNIVARMRLLVRLKELTGFHSQNQIAKEFNWDSSWVWGALVLENLTDEVIGLVERGDEEGRKLAISSAQTIARVPREEQEALARRVLREGIPAKNLKAMLSHGSDVSTPEEPVEISDSNKTPKPKQDVLQTMLRVLVESDQKLAGLRTFTWEQFSDSFTTEAEADNVRRQLAHVALRVGEFDEMLKAVLRTKFQ